MLLRLGGAWALELSADFRMMPETGICFAFFQQSLMTSALPIDEILPNLIDALQRQPSVVLRAPPGAGKTTRVPPAILNAGLAARGLIVMLEPRRIAARTSARRIASERGERVGETVGYRVRFDECVGPNTRIVVLTEGVLLRRLQDDPFLDGIDVILFDEFHERRLDSDLALAMARRVQQTVRPDLRIVVMSATLDPLRISTFLGQCPALESEGRLHPVRIEYQKQQERTPIPALAARGVERVVGMTSGDVLVFLPGVGEILRTQRELDTFARRHHIAIMPLYGDLSAEEQDRVIAPGDRRKVVLSTNVAETSVTIEGVTAVVDTGLARQMQFDSSAGLDRLELTPISKASADQRAGRAGRTQPGVCLRLWDESTHRLRPDFERAEIHRVDLSSTVLRLRAWGESDLEQFPWFEAPPPSSVAHAEQLLRLLSATDDRGVTPLGHILVRLPVPPRIGRLLIEGRRLGQRDRCVLLAAMLSERDPFHVNRQGPAVILTQPNIRSGSDVLDRLAAYESFQKTGQTETRFGFVSASAARSIQHVTRQLNQLLAQLPDTEASKAKSDSQLVPSDEAVLRAIAAAFPDRIAKRRESGSDRGIMVGGRGVRIGPRSAVTQATLFACVDVDGKGPEAHVRQASEVQREWLAENLMRTTDDLFFHPSQKQVVARKRTWFSDLLLDEVPTAISDWDAAAEVLFYAVRGAWETARPVDEELDNFLNRVRCLALWRPDLKFPVFDDVAFLEVLRSLCHQRRSVADLRSAPWLATLKSRLNYAQQQLLDREVPERLAVPSGTRIRLTYEVGKSPVLAVRMQEIFGWQQTPRVAGGRVPVVLHLLAPNMRPQQITDDLASFWVNTYPEVRKELKRRYPKHAWPDDPLTAPAVKKG